MDETCSESELSLSPSQILERLQMLRQLQLMQRGKLHKQRLQYKETSETSSSITEIVSHFSNSTSYNTFRSLLQSSNDISNDGTPRLNTSGLSPNIQERDLIDGVSVLNVSQESEFVVNSPVSSRSRVSAPSRTEDNSEEPPIPNIGISPASSKNFENETHRKEISLDEMPILSPRKDFETLLLEKLQNEKNISNVNTKKGNSFNAQTKKPFLKRGEGMARFGIKKNNLIIQNTKSLPWKKNKFKNKNTESPLKLIQTSKQNNKQEVQILITEPQRLVTELKSATLTRKSQSTKLTDTSPNSNTTEKTNKETDATESVKIDGCELHKAIPPTQKNNARPLKHPLLTNKGKTWASVLTKEQDDFLRQLKQSDYYKNFTSPAKSIVSDVSYDETSKFRLDKELAEQNMFELLENKVTHESFNIESSFFDRFLRKNNLECSGESTPLVLQKCLAQNPDLMHILPEMQDRIRNEYVHSDAETCCSNYTDCCSDACSSVSCCSCNTVEPANNSTQSSKQSKDPKKESKSKQRNNTKKVHIEIENKKSHNDTLTDNDAMKENMAEMNAKLIATSELLKDRLRELEDEIETFRKENANLVKLREEVDQERQRFYEEKAAFEQKYNEEKVLSEYYLAEEKEKLAKQKQTYERYVREMRGRLNKKDKDEVVNLKREVSELKDEIRLKDAKSTSTIARLRNQIKIMEKEKKELNEEVEKLKKQNRRIQHSNEVTRRLTNIKYLEEINKKLSNMSSRDTRSEVVSDRNIKYKAHEIERQSRIRKVLPAAKGTLRPRAKSVPNLNVTSRYAKYFSQRDTISQVEHNKLNLEGLNTSNDENIECDTLSNGSESVDVSTNEDDNHLEKLYMERFRSISPKSNRSSGTNSNSEHVFLEKPNLNENTKGFFINKSNSSRSSKSPKRSISPYLNHSRASVNRSKSPVSILSNRSNDHRSPNMQYTSDYISNNSVLNYPQNRSKSPVSMSNQSQRTATVIHNDQYRDKLNVLSPEPSSSKTSLTKTNLNPTEVRNPDGSRELRFPNGNIKYLSSDGKYSKFVYYNGDVKENFYNEGRIKYFYAETKTYHTTHPDGLEVLEFPDGQVEKRYKDGSSEIRLPNGSARYFDPKNEHVREEWRFPDGAAMTVSASGEQRIVFSNGQIEVHAKDHKRREFPDGTVKLVYNDGTSETRYASGRVRIKDKHGNLLMDSAPG